MKTLNGILLVLVGLLVFYGVRQEFRVIKTGAVIESVKPTNDTPPVPLRVLVRRGYFSDKLLAEAEAALNIDFQVTFYRSDDECLRQLDSGAAWDLMLVPDHLALRLDRLNQTFDIDYERIPNHRNMVLGLPAREEMGALYRCSVPLFFTVIGLGYNSGLIGSIPLSWNALFAPPNAALLRGHLGLLNEPRRCLGTALIALGKSPNTTNPVEIKQAAALVKECLSHIATMDRSPDALHGGAEFIAQEILRRRVFLGMITSASISRAMQQNSALRFSCPTDGSLLCIDCLVLPRTTRDRLAAEATINFLLRPRISAQLTNESGFATTNEAATAYFATELYHGPAFATPTGSQFFYLQDVGPAEALYADAWRGVAGYFHTNDEPALNRQLGFDLTFIESNDTAP